MTVLTTLREPAIRQYGESSRRANPLRNELPERKHGSEFGDVPHGSAVALRNAQMPGFPPLLEELEMAGWSSHRRGLGGNFHDWMLLDGRSVLVVAGRAIGRNSNDPFEATLVAQAAWAAIRAHAQHASDAGTILSGAAHSLWPIANTDVRMAVAVALIDTTEGQGSLAMAGDCLAWKVRAAVAEQLPARQPPLGGTPDFTYLSQTVQLALRERLLLVADDPQTRSPKLAALIASSFAQLDAESHRRMVAADALCLVRQQFETELQKQQSPVSIVAVRRR